MRNPLPEIDLHLRVRKYDQKFFQEQVKMQKISVSKCKIASPNKLLTLLKLLLLPQRKVQTVSLLKNMYLDRGLMLQTNIVGYSFLVRYSLTFSCHIYNFDDSIIIHLYICQSDWGTRSNQFLLKWASKVVPNPEDTYYYWGILNGMYFFFT